MINKKASISLNEHLTLAGKNVCFLAVEGNWLFALVNNQYKVAQGGLSSVFLEKGVWLPHTLYS